MKTVIDGGISMKEECTNHVNETLSMHGWNEHNIDQFIFNSCIGGACVFEYCNDDIHMIRVSAKYAEVIGSAGMTSEAALALRWSDYLDEENLKIMQDAVRLSIATKDEVTSEYVFCNLPAAPSKTYLRSSLRVIDQQQDRFLIYCMNENITARKEAEYKKEIIQKQLKVIMDNVGSGITATKIEDAGVEFLFSNDRYYEILGYTRGEYHTLFDKTFGPILKEDLDYVMICIKRAAFLDEPLMLEFRALRKDGKLIWLRDRITRTQFIGRDDTIQLSIIDDITEEKASLEEIHLLNENLITLMKDVPGGYVRLQVRPDGSGIPIEVSDGFCSIVGLRQEEIKKRYWENMTQMIHPDDRMKVQNAIRELFDNKGKTGIRYRIQQNNREYSWVQMHGRLTRNEQGEYFLNAYYYDLSEKEKEEVTLLDSMPVLLRAIMESSTDLVFAKDREFRYICCSNTFVQFAGLQSMEEVVGKTDEELFGSQIATQFRKDDMLLLKNGESIVDKVETIPSTDGVTHYVTTSKYPLRDIKDHLTGIYGVARDITEYRNSYAQLKLLTDSIPGGIATFFVKGDELRIIYCNDGFSRIVGYNPDSLKEYAPNAMLKLIEQEDAVAILEQLERLKKYNIPMDVDYRIYNHKDYSMRWINLKGVIFEKRDDVYIVNTVQCDITKAKKKEESNRIHEEELKLAMAQLGRSIGEYDINTQTLYMSQTYAQKYQFPEVRTNIPDCMRDSGELSEEMFGLYKDFIDSIHRGKKSATLEIEINQVNGTTRWERIESMIIYSEEGLPIKALLALDNTTEQHKRFEIEQKRPTLGAGNLLVHALFDLTDKKTIEYCNQDGSAVPIEEQLEFLNG